MFPSLSSIMPISSRRKSMSSPSPAYKHVHSHAVCVVRTSHVVCTGPEATHMSGCQHARGRRSVAGDGSFMSDSCRLFMVSDSCRHFMVSDGGRPSYGQQLLHLSLVHICLQMSEHYCSMACRARLPSASKLQSCIRLNAHIHRKTRV